LATIWRIIKAIGLGLLGSMIGEHALRESALASDSFANSVAFGALLLLLHAWINTPSMSNKANSIAIFFTSTY
jgi:hypothetical protein